MIKLIILLFAPIANAGILFEPYAGYSMGSIKRTDKGSSSSVSANADGFSYGGRLAWKFGVFFLGGEYQGVRGTIRSNDDSPSSNWTSSALFGVMGWQFRNGFRLIGGVNAKPIEIKEESSPHSQTYESSAMKIGVGYEYRSPIAINAEYITYKPEKIKISGETESISSSYSKFTYSAIMLSLSFPFEIGEN